MQPEEIFLPVDYPYRNHLLLLYGFVHSHILAAEIAQAPDIGIETFVDKARLAKMIEVIEKNPETEISLTLEDVLATFACHHIMNRILVSEYDSLLTQRILDKVKEGHHIKNLDDFRRNMIKTNTALLNNFKNFYEYTDEFAILEKQFRQWEF